MHLRRSYLTGITLLSNMYVLLYTLTYVPLSTSKSLISGLVNSVTRVICSKNAIPVVQLWNCCEIAFLLYAKYCTLKSLRPF